MGNIQGLYYTVIHLLLGRFLGGWTATLGRRADSNSGLACRWQLRVGTLPLHLQPLHWWQIHMAAPPLPGHTVAYAVWESPYLRGTLCALTSMSLLTSVRKVRLCKTMIRI